MENLGNLLGNTCILKKNVFRAMAFFFKTYSPAKEKAVRTDWAESLPVVQVVLSPPLAAALP